MAQGYYTVVVADDEDELREAICEMVPWEKAGFRLVGAARNGLDALQLVEKLEPDLLITDIRMPFISGIELARQIREVRPSIHIAFLSGHDDFEYAKQAIQYNIISYMLKPISLEGLEKELRAIKVKIDQQFSDFQEHRRQQSGRDSFLMPLLLDTCAPTQRERLVRDAVEIGLLRDKNDTPAYVVMVAAFFNTEGENVTQPSSVNAVNMVLRKYLRHGSFYSNGRVVSLLVASPADFAYYQHILAEEISQMAGRVMDLRCQIGLSHQGTDLAALNLLYRRAVEAYGYAVPEQGGICCSTDLQPDEGCQTVALKSGQLLCEQAMELIEKTYSDDSLSLVSLSEALHVSPSYLSVSIRKYAGDSFINILIRRRMEKARELLLASPAKVVEIARACGYSDQHYFSYCFKKYFGCSPLAMRRKEMEP